MTLVGRRRYESFRTKLLRILALKQEKKLQGKRVAKQESIYFRVVQHKAVPLNFATLTSSAFVTLMTTIYLTPYKFVPRDP